MTIIKGVSRMGDNDKAYLVGCERPLTDDELRDLHAYLGAWQPMLFFHATPSPDACQHDFKGWREFSDGNGGEAVCTKCGMGAMTYSLRTGA